MAAETTASPKVSPSGRRAFGGDDEAGALVAGRHELEEQGGGVSFEGDVADLVDDDERVTPESQASGSGPGFCRWVDSRRP
jgi:hypothetical protein